MRNEKVLGFCCARFLKIDCITILLLTLTEQKPKEYEKKYGTEAATA